MNRFGFIVAVIIVASAFTSGATTYTGTGNWIEDGNWSAGQPGEGDGAEIGSGANVTVDSDVGTIKHLTAQGGTMNMDGGALILSNSLVNAFWSDFNLNLSNSSSFDHVHGVHNVFLSAGGASIDVDNSSLTMISGMQQFSPSATYSITISNGSTFSIPSYWAYRGTNEFNVEGDGNTVTLGSFDAYDAGDGSHPNTFNLTPGATGIDAITVSGAVDLSGTDDTLNVDLSSYNTNNGLVLVLLDYGSLTGTFDATNITGFAGTNAEIDHTYNIDGAGDMGIALHLNGIEPISWDGDAGDGSWQTAANWSRDFVPTVNDDAYVGLGYIVTNAPSDPVSFKSLETAAGSSVTFDGEFFTDFELTVRGTLTNLGQVFRLWGSTTMDVYGTISKGISLRNEITYNDGASQGGNFFIENQGARVVNFVLSETGFTTLTMAGWLFQQGLWSDTTINVDISAYDRTLGTTIYLMDFSNYSSSDPEANFTNATRNVTGHAGGELSWDAVNDRIVLEIVPITGTIITVQ